MKRRILTILVLGTFLPALSVPKRFIAQTCNDDESMVKSYEKTLTNLVSAVQKESLSDFQSHYHEQSCLTDLNLSLSLIDSLLDCLSKAAKDPAATKEQTDAAKNKTQEYSKLKSVLTQDLDALKAVKEPKAAKALIEKFTIVV
jgi:uncharacterized protein YfaS (alpha-2-macroglobulin family)